MLHPVEPNILRRNCPACPAYQSCVFAIAEHLIVKCVFFGLLKEEIEAAVDKLNIIPLSMIGGVESLFKSVIMFRVHKKSGDAVVLLLPSKEKPVYYSFVNLTKGHICPCKFESIAAAIEDMESKKIAGEIISYDCVAL